MTGKTPHSAYSDWQIVSSLTDMSQLQLNVEPRTCFFAREKTNEQRPLPPPPPPNPSILFRVGSNAGSNIAPTKIRLYSHFGEIRHVPAYQGAVTCRWQGGAAVCNR